MELQNLATDLPKEIKDSLAFVDGVKKLIVDTKAAGLSEVSISDIEALVPEAEAVVADTEKVIADV